MLCGDFVDIEGVFDCGMVMDFVDVKVFVMEYFVSKWDYVFLVYVCDEVVWLFFEQMVDYKMVVIDWILIVENFVVIVFDLFVNVYDVYYGVNLCFECVCLYEMLNCWVDVECQFGC